LACSTSLANRESLCRETRSASEESWSGRGVASFQSFVERSESGSGISFQRLCFGEGVLSEVARAFPADSAVVNEASAAIVFAERFFEPCRVGTRSGAFCRSLLREGGVGGFRGFPVAGPGTPCQRAVSRIDGNGSLGRGETASENQETRNNERRCAESSACSSPLGRAAVDTLAIEPSPQRQQVVPYARRGRKRLAP